MVNKMEREIGCVYPKLAMKKYGIPKQTSKEVNISTADGVYLEYIFAMSCLHEESIYLVFDPNLLPSHVRVRNVDGKITEPWTLSHVDIDKLKVFASKLNINVDNFTTKELVRKVLLEVNQRERVAVPAYENT